MEVIMNKNQKDGNFEENLGSRVKKLRQEMNLTQAEVADALHVTPGYISNVENNRTAMSLRILIYYAKLMNTTLLVLWSLLIKRTLWTMKLCIL